MDWKFTYNLVSTTENKSAKLESIIDIDNIGVFLICPTLIGVN